MMRLLATALIALLTQTAITTAKAQTDVSPIQTFTSKTALEAFDQMWQAFDEHYAMFTLRPEVDWKQLREFYRPLAAQTKSPDELAGVLADMLRPLRDLHVRLNISNNYVPIYYRPRELNANPSAYPHLLGELHGAGESVRWSVTPDNIGYLEISAWDSASVSDYANESLEQMRNTRALIVDVRLNGGGDEPTARKVAGRFVPKKFVYSYSQFRNGPQHRELTDKRGRVVQPSGPWRYDRPVVLLIGQKCLSSNESFIGMMCGDPDLVTMGDHSGGSSGNPMRVTLPMDISVTVPRWIDYLPDGTPLDEKGFQPAVPFKAAADSFKGDRDDLLSAAIERLQKEPLPPTPIQGKRFEKSSTAE